MDQKQHLNEEPHSSDPHADRAAQRRSTPTQNEQRRWQVISLLEHGLSLSEIAATTGYQPRTVRRIIKRYREFGAAGLLDKRHHSAGATPLLSPEQQYELCEALRHSPPDDGIWTGTQVAEWIATRIGRPVHRQRGWEYLHRFKPDQDPDADSATTNR